MTIRRRTGDEKGRDAASGGSFTNRLRIERSPWGGVVRVALLLTIDLLTRAA